MRSMKRYGIRELAVDGVMMALVLVATLIRLPVPTYRLYFNMGEAVIYSAALLLGAKAGAVIGGVGAALADLVLGYPVWAPITLVIKGLEGYIVGSISQKSWRKRGLGVFAGAMLMIAGYAVAAGLLYGLPAVPIELGGDIVQCGVGAAVALPLARALRRHPLFSLRQRDGD